MTCDRLTEDSVDALVTSFYARIRRDPELAPIFEKALAGRWDSHMATMREFWCSALRMKRGYRGDMLAAHRKLGTLPPAAFARWLALFRETVTEGFAQEPADVILDRAEKTARNLETALFGGSYNARQACDGVTP
jgi:hemoglobin